MLPKSLPSDRPQTWRPGPIADRRTHAVNGSPIRRQQPRKPVTQSATRSLEVSKRSLPRAALPIRAVPAARHRQGVSTPVKGLPSATRAAGWGVSIRARRGRTTRVSAALIPGSACCPLMGHASGSRSTRTTHWCSVLAQPVFSSRLPEKESCHVPTTPPREGGAWPGLLSKEPRRLRLLIIGRAPTAARGGGLPTAIPQKSCSLPRRPPIVFVMPEPPHGHEPS